MARKARRRKLCQPFRSLKSCHAWISVVTRHRQMKGTMSVPTLRWGIRATSEMKNALIRAVKALPATACRSTGARRVTICSGTGARDEEVEEFRRNHEVNSFL